MTLWDHKDYIYLSIYLVRRWNFPGQNTRVGSLPLLQGIFPIQGSNPCLLHCRQILYQLSHKGSPNLNLVLQINTTYSGPYTRYYHLLILDSLHYRIKGNTLLLNFTTKQLLLLLFFMLSKSTARKQYWRAVYTLQILLFSAACQTDKNKSKNTKQYSSLHTFSKTFWDPFYLKIITLILRWAPQIVSS